jgi:hypothetical protein
VERPASMRSTRRAAQRWRPAAERAARMMSAINDEQAVTAMAGEWARREVSAADRMRVALERRGLPADVLAGEGLAWVSIWAGLCVRCWQHSGGVEFQWPPEDLLVDGWLQPDKRRVAGLDEEQACVEMIAEEMAVRAPQ